MHMPGFGGNRIRQDKILAKALEKEAVRRPSRLEVSLGRDSTSLPLLAAVEDH
jgi:hypothetical protein